MFDYQPVRWYHERPYLLGGLLFLLVLYTPYWLQGQNAYFVVHDFLDDSSYNFAPLVQSGQTFNVSPLATVPNIMNGLPRSAMHSGLYVSVWLFALLPPFLAILINFLLVHLVGFVSMFALLRTYVLNRPTDSGLATGVALVFAAIPTYTNYGLSVMGQPALLLAFLNLLNGRAGWQTWILIVAFPFYSFLVRSGLYLVAGLAIFGGVQNWRRKQINAYYWLGLILLGGLYFLVDFPMIGAYITGAFTSHRTEYALDQLMSPGVLANIVNAGRLFVQGQYHAGTFYPYAILLLWLGWLLLVRGKTTLPHWLMGCILVICLLHGLYPLLITHSGLPRQLSTVFQFDRFYFLLPLLWSLLLGVLLVAITDRRTAVIFIGFQLVLTFACNQEWMTNLRSLTGSQMATNQPSYRAFFAQKLFQSIRKSLPGSPADYRVASIGMHPIVAQVNGFYTLDSYQNNYPLAYKRQFRQLMAEEWSKPTARLIRPYFDAYGNRCYIFPTELRMNCLIGKTAAPVVRDLQFNTALFKVMGGRYIFSAVAIKSADRLGWRLVGIFSNRESYWRVWIYAV